MRKISEKTYTFQVKNFNLNLTLESGQIFRWKKTEDGWLGEIKRNIILVKQQKEKLIVRILYSKTKTLEKKDIEHFFSLNEDVNKIYSRITTDSIIKEAIKEFYGLRLIHQEEWPCIVGFVTSAFSNIPRIEKTLDRIAEEHGEAVEIIVGNKKMKFYLFPTIEQIRKSNIKKLRKCGLGFRDKYVHEISKELNENEIKKIKEMNYINAKKRLMQLPGIGDKVADCILLFSFEKYEAFPIDVWIKRIMNNLYGEEMKKYFSKAKKEFNYKEIQEFARHKWNEYAGYAQQFLYIYAKKHKNRCL